MKTKLCLVLCFALAFAPVVTAQEAPPKTDQPCFIEIIGLVLLVGVYCMNRWGDVKWQPSPPLPYPPLFPPDTNAPPMIDIGLHRLVVPSLEVGPMMGRNIADSGAMNTYSATPEPWASQSTFVVQVSTNLTEWRDWTRVTLWKSQTGTLVSLDDGTNVLVSYNPINLRAPSSPPGNFYRTVAK